MKFHPLSRPRRRKSLTFVLSILESERGNHPATDAKQLHNGASLRDRRWQAFRFGSRFFVQGFGKFLQAGNDLRRLGQNS